MVMLLFSLAFAFIATEQLIEHVGLPISILKDYVRFDESWYTYLTGRKYSQTLGFMFVHMYPSIY